MGRSPRVLLSYKGTFPTTGEFWMLLDSAKQLLSKGVLLQRDSADLQGQFQGPTVERGREQVRGDWLLSKLGAPGPGREWGLLIPKPRRSEGPRVWLQIIIAHIRHGVIRGPERPECTGIRYLLWAVVDGGRGSFVHGPLPG